MYDVYITIIVDNKTIDGCNSEHGYAIWIESGDKKILFDTGQSGNTLISNAKTLGIDLSTADILILSHGHFDHTGGIPEILNLSPEIDIYLHPALTSPRYLVANGSARDIGVPNLSLESLNKHPRSRIHHVTGPTQITEQIQITGEIPRSTNFEDTGGSFFLNSEGSIEDLLPDDLSIWIKTKKGLLVCTGCCHSGLINTLTHIKKSSKEDKFDTLIGGLHLLHGNDERINKTIMQLKQFSINQIIPCHCTGKRAVELFSKHFHCTEGYVGMELFFDQFGEIEIKRVG